MQTGFSFVKRYSRPPVQRCSRILPPETGSAVYEENPCTYLYRKSSAIFGVNAYRMPAPTFQTGIVVGNDQMFLLTLAKPTPARAWSETTEIIYCDCVGCKEIGSIQPSRLVIVQFDRPISNHIQHSRRKSGYGVDTISATNSCKSRSCLLQQKLERTSFDGRSAANAMVLTNPAAKEPNNFLHKIPFCVFDEFPYHRVGWITNGDILPLTTQCCFDIFKPFWMIVLFLF